MVRLLIPTGLATQGRKAEFCAVEAQHVQRKTLVEYLADISIQPDDLSHVVYRGVALWPQKQERRYVQPQTIWRRIVRQPPRVVIRWESDLELCMPGPQDEFHVIPKVDGKNGSLILGVVGAIVGGALAAETGGSSLVLVQWALAGYAIGSTIGALIAPKPNNNRIGDGSPTTYTWGGIQNEYREGVPAPVIFGRHKVGIVRVGAFIRRDGDDSTETLHILGLVSVGPVTSITDVRVNDQPYTNFPGSRIETRLGGSGQTPLDGFNAIANTVPTVNEFATVGQSFVYSTTPNRPVDSLELLFQCPALFHGTAKGDRQNTSNFQWRVRPKGGAYGAWHVDKIVGTTRSAKLKTVRITSPDIPSRGEYDIEMQWTGSDFTDASADAWKIDLTGVTEEQQDTRTYDGYAMVAVRSLATSLLNGSIPQISVLCEGLPLETWNGSGFTAPAFFGGGDTVNQAGHLTGTIGRDPAWIVLKILRDRSWNHSGTLSALTSSGTTATATASAAHSLSTGERVTISDATPAEYNGTYTVTVTDATHFTYIFAGSATTPATSAGSFVGSRYDAFGLGDWIADTDIDLNSFIALSARAQQLVSVTEADDSGAPVTTYTEPRFLLDIPPNQEVRALDLIQQLLATCRASLVFSGNKWKVVTEQPAAPTQLFTVGNILGNTFDLTYSADRSITSLIPQYLDERRDYQTTTDVTVDGPGVTKYNQSRRAETQQWTGVTRRSQVRRESKFALNKRWYIRRLAGFGVGPAGILAEAGDVINVQHDIPQWGFGGSVVEDSQDTTIIMVDRDLIIVAGKTYGLLVRYQDGSADAGESRVVADGPGTYSAVTVTVPFSQIPKRGDVYTFGEIPAKPFTIVEVSDSDDSSDSLAVVAVEYNESIEDDADNIVIPVYSALPRFLAPPPPILSATATSTLIQMGDGSYSTVIDVQWTPPAPADGYGIYDYADVEWSFDGGVTYTPAPLGQGVRSHWTDKHADQGTLYYFRITPVSTRGIKNGAGAATCSVTTAGKSTKPPAPTGFAAATQDGSFLFSWNPVAVGDANQEIRYELRTADPLDWGADPTGYLARVDATHYEIDTPVQRTYTLYLRAVDKWGNYSAGSSTVTYTDARPAAPNFGSIVITRSKNTLKIAVPASVDSDVFAQHLHASQSSGFTPSSATLVSGVVGPGGGEFVFAVPASGTWYFKVACEDWLSQQLNDWNYSTQVSSSVIVITPVDPTAVAFTITPDEQKVVVDPGNGGQRPVTTQKVTVTWSHTGNADGSDSLNPKGALKGFRVLLYKATEDIDHTIFDEVVMDPAKRTKILHSKAMAEAISYIVAVEAVYLDDVNGALTSNFVTSGGVTVPQSTNPTLRDHDDRNIYAYAQSFQNQTAFPTGISQTGLTVVGWQVGGGHGLLATVNSGAAGFTITWNYPAWVTAYLDATSSNFFQKALIKFGGPNLAGPSVPVSGHNVDITIQPTLRFTDSGGFTHDVPFSMLQINDAGDYHNYVVAFAGGIPNGNYLAPSKVQWIFPAGMFNTGDAILISAIAMGTNDYDPNIDGVMTRAINARNQFGMSNLSFWLQSPVRLTDDNSQVTVVDKNGIFWVTSGDGSQSPFKNVRRALLQSVPSATFVNWNDETYLHPALRLPTALSKVKILLTRHATTDTLIANPAANGFYPKRFYAEATEFSTSGFRLVSAQIDGSSFVIYRDVGANPWTATNGHGFIMTLGTASPTVNNGDAWANPYSNGLNIPASSSTNPFRAVLWFRIDMPLMTKNNGSYYVVDFTFHIYGQTGQPVTTNPLVLASSSDFGSFTMRCYTDGKTWRAPWVYGNANTLLLQAWKTDWTTQTNESGAPTITPTNVLLETYELHSITPGNFAAGGASTMDYDVLMLEEF